MNTKRPRGRPRKIRDNLFSIGSGPEYKFPIVQEDTVKKPVAFLTVGSRSFEAALEAAVNWAKDYSLGRSGKFFPLVRYKGLDNGISAEKRYVMAVSPMRTFAYAENRDVGSYLPISMLEVVS